ncbi:MAG: S8 family serine peptidase, partial [Thermoanaerobaculales bacterium]|nr:S8 family serine peptidase [Thermoanaerobaculales bacterium]
MSILRASDCRLLVYLVGMAWAVASVVAAEQAPTAFTPHGDLRVVEGVYTPTEVPLEEPDGSNGVAVDPPSPFASLPVLSKTLENTIAEVSADEMLRVIIMLRHLPQDRISAEVQARHAAEKAAIDTEVNAILEATAARRDPTLPRDADNHPELIKTFPQEREALRPLNLRREALDKAIIDEMIPEIAVELAPFFDRVRSAVEELGGEFEFSTIAGSLVVARVPAGRISSLAEHPDILRISEDVLFYSTLDIMDDATLVSAPGGLWDSGFDGGIFDPAIIDTGTDIYHPGMANGTSPARENFYTWFLTAAAAEPTFDDVATQDDLQGHGTHVAGIVGCYGSSDYEDHLGMAYGVEKLVTLKAGWRDTSNRGRIKLTDMCGIVDRALNHSGDLFPQGAFGDDVDGMNYSFGAATSEDETSSSRFFDAVISSYPDLPVTIAAGNSGPDNVNFSSSASSYNAITVGNVSDRATPDRADDIINPTSTAGPTAYGRRKPDLAAPGTNIKAPDNEWENYTFNHYITKSGTSMSAPAVLGVIMSLMDAGVADELALKALLINTAQKNDAGIDIESDPDGWDPQIGFGYMNALAAFGHRSDIFQGVVTPRDSLGDYRLYKGVMRDEGPTGEGRDRATMVWNRHATYTPAA